MNTTALTKIKDFLAFKEAHDNANSKLATKNLHSKLGSCCICPQCRTSFIKEHSAQMYCNAPCQYKCNKLRQRVTEEPLRISPKDIHNALYCPKRIVNQRRVYVYLIQNKHGGPIKIGLSTNPYLRFCELVHENAYPIRLLLAFRGDENTERMLHKKFNHVRLHGEWFADCKEIQEYIIDKRAKLGEKEIKLSPEIENRYYSAEKAEMYDKRV